VQSFVSLTGSNLKQFPIKVDRRERHKKSICLQLQLIFYRHQSFPIRLVEKPLIIHIICTKNQQNCQNITQKKNHLIFPIKSIKGG
jgi:hypothetical protein